jgi:hypothetical protein
MPFSTLLNRHVRRCPAGGTGSRLGVHAPIGYILGLFRDLAWTRGLDLTVGENRR